MFTTKQAGLDPQLLSKLKKINAKQMDGMCQWMAIQAALVLLDEKHDSDCFEVRSIESKDPLESKELKNQAYACCRNAHQLMTEIDSLSKDELFIVNGESEDIDHAFIIFKNQDGNVWLIDADRGVYRPIKNSNDFIHPVTGWEEGRSPLATHLDYLRLELVPASITSDKEDLEKIKCHIELYHFTIKNTDLLTETLSKHCPKKVEYRT